MDRAAKTAAGLDVVVKVSRPCRETRDEAAALAAWHGAGTSATRRGCGRLGAAAAPAATRSTLRDERLPPVEHLTIGAELLRRMAAVPVPAGEPFQDLVRLAGGLAVTAAERVERLLAYAPDPDRHRTLPPRR